MPFQTSFEYWPPTRWAKFVHWLLRRPGRPQGKFVERMEFVVPPPPPPPDYLDLQKWHEREVATILRRYGLA